MFTIHHRQHGRCSHCQTTIWETGLPKTTHRPATQKHYRNGRTACTWIDLPTSSSSDNQYCWPDVSWPHARTRQSDLQLGRSQRVRTARFRCSGLLFTTAERRTVCSLCCWTAQLYRLHWLRDEPKIISGTAKPFDNGGTKQNATATRVNVVTLYRREGRGRRYRTALHDNFPTTICSTARTVFACPCSPRQRARITITHPSVHYYHAQYQTRKNKTENVERSRWPYQLIVVVRLSTYY